MPKITEATDEQWEAIDRLKERWIERQTRQYCHKTVVVIVQRMYERVGSACSLVLQAPSPLSLVIWDALLSSQLDDQLDDQLGSQLYSQLYSQLDDQLGSQLDSQLYSQLFSQLDSQLFRPYVGVCWRACSGWYLGGRLLGVRFDDSVLSLFVCWNECASVWTARKGVCVVSSNPIAVCWEDGRLHNTGGPSVLYRDGYSLWTIQGVPVDKQIVMSPETQTISQIQGEPNAEAKRIRIERYGWAKYVEQAGGFVVDSRRNDIEATHEMLLRADEFTVLLATCKTGRLFSLDVPPEIETCEQAQAWLHRGSETDRMLTSTRVIGRS
jgi:hypothetical protein